MFDFVGNGVSQYSAPEILLLNEQVQMEAPVKLTYRVPTDSLSEKCGYVPDPPLHRQFLLSVAGWYAVVEVAFEFSAVPS